MKLHTKDGSQIDYQTYGSPTKPALLLLHGNNGSQQDFKAYLPLFAHDFYVITQDARGHGQSTNNQLQLNYQLLASDLEELRVAVNIPTWSILGYSDGANLALRYTLDNPAHVHALVLNAPNLTINGLTKPIVLIASWVEWLLGKLRNIHPFFEARWQQTGLMFKTPGISKRDLQAVMAPTLVLVGQFDFIKRRHSLNIAPALCNGTLYVAPFKTHLFIQFSPLVFSNIVRQFLKEH